MLRYFAAFLLAADAPCRLFLFAMDDAFRRC